MTDGQFDNLVRKLEDRFRCNPTDYRFRVSLLAILGNVYVSSILLLFFGLLAALFVSIKWFSWIAVKPIGFVWVFLCLILRSSWVKIEPPAGIEITASQAPELFATINVLRRKLGAPRFHKVLITDELNAAVLQLPRLGIFGWPRNYLMIGMPLMKSLTCEQFKAVLSHEIGHLAKGHGIVSHSIYRQRLRWSRLMAALEASESKGSFLFMPFLNWFVPYFAAFSFPLARANEYEADAISVRLTSSRSTAEALTSSEVVGGYLTDFYWPLIDAEFGEQSQPSREPYFEMSETLATRLDKVTGIIWLGPAMARQTTSEDTHPALSERLAAIGEEPSFSPPEPGQSADGLLGPSLEVTTKALDTKWKHSILSAWELRHEETQQGRRRLKELTEKHATGVNLTVQEGRERAELTESIVKDANSALDQLRALHESFPDDANICLALGAHLIKRNDDAGCDLVKHALQSDEDAILQGCELLCDYYSRNGPEEAYHAWNTLLIEEAEAQRDAHEERNRVSPTDEFQRHELPKETLAALVAQLRPIPGLSTAYLMKKRLLFSQQPLYVLGYTVTASLFPSAGKRAREVFERVQNGVQFPGDTFIINVEGQKFALRRKFSRMRWAKVFNRGSSVFLRLAKSVCKKLFALLAICFGLFALSLTLNDIFRFTSVFDPEEPGIGLSIGRLLFGTLMIAVGIRWLIEPID